MEICTQDSEILLKLSTRWRTSAAKIQRVSFLLSQLIFELKKAQRVVAGNSSDGYLKVVVWGFQKTHMPLKNIYIKIN